MRKAWLLLLLAPSALVFACGGDDSGTDGGSDAANDNTTKPDSGGDAANDTGTTPERTPDAGDAGNDVSITITCLKPADCIDGGGDAAFPPDSGEVCCGTVQTSGSFPQCSFNSASTACQAPGACPTTVNLQSCGTDQVRLCEADKECTEKGGRNHQHVQQVLFDAVPGCRPHPLLREHGACRRERWCDHLPLRLVYATRKSALALAQCRAFVARLAGEHELVEKQVTTSGDRIQDRPLSEVGGKGSS